MELRLLGTRGIPDGSIVSIRLGGVRRQALLGSERPYRFAQLAAGKQPLRVDVFAPVAHARLLVEASGKSQCSVPLDAPLSAGGSAEVAEHGCSMRLDFELRSLGRSLLAGDNGVHASVQEDAPLGAASQPYYEHHCLGDFFQMLLQSLLQDRPPDPSAYIARLLQNSHSACAGHRALDAAKAERCADTVGSGGGCGALASTIPFQQRSPRFVKTESLGRLARAASAGQLHQGPPAVALRRQEAVGSSGSRSRPGREVDDRRQRPPMLMPEVLETQCPMIAPDAETLTPGSRDDGPRSGGTCTGSALRASSRPERRRLNVPEEAAVVATPVARLRNQRSRCSPGIAVETDDSRGPASASGIRSRSQLSPIAAESGAADNDDDAEDVEDADAEEAHEDPLFSFDGMASPQTMAEAACRAVGIADEVMSGQRPISEASEATLVAPAEENGSAHSADAKHVPLPTVLSGRHGSGLAVLGHDVSRSPWPQLDRSVEDLVALAREALVRAGSRLLADELERAAPLHPPGHVAMRVLSIHGETSALLSRTAELESRMERFEAEREDLRAAIQAHLSSTQLSSMCGLAMDTPAELLSAESGL